MGQDAQVILDLDDSINRAWNPEVKEILIEAHRCLSTGANRSTVILTWVAVCTDILEKIVSLHEDGDSQASETARELERIRDGNFGLAEIVAMQKIERSVLDKARLLELIDEVEKRDLERLREDRHLCSHPSMRQLGRQYNPSTEVARAHLATALQALLVHPPTQGKKALERFLEYVGSNPFVANRDHLLAQFFDKVRSATRRQLLELSAKHALLQLEAPTQVAASVLADRMAICFGYFATRDQGAATSAMRKVIERFAAANHSLQKAALGRIGHLTAFWMSCPPSLMGHMGELIEYYPPSENDPIDTVHARMLALTGNEVARESLPNLPEVFMRQDSYDQASIISSRPAQYFVQYLPSMVERSGQWRWAEHVTRNAVLPCSQYMAESDVRAILAAWANNSQARTASGMQDLAVQFFDAVRQLGESRIEIFSAFVSDARSREPRNSQWRYHRLDGRISSSEEA
jgi:hypothetical protein